MQDKYKELLIAFVLVLICPAVIMHLYTERMPIEINENTEFVEISSATFAPDEGKTINILSNNGEIINMALDEYLVAVLLCEMPISFDEEALKAQAVVARTYTLRRLEHVSKHPVAPVCVDSGCCQGYLSPETYCARGGTIEDVEKARKAVLDTAGKVLVYNNELIDATYFSCSGGMTEDALAVWGADIPYLQSKASPGEENAQHYVDTKYVSVDEFMTSLKLENNDSIIKIGKIEYTAGGGIATITIGGKVFEGVEIRQMLGLGSTAFEIKILGNQVEITTKGFGHRVGMSQYGAEAMAVQGKTYEDILLYYYEGVEIKTDCD